MLLDYLDDHLLREIATYLSDHDLNALVQTCRRTSGRLNNDLYYRNIPSGERPYVLEWAVDKNYIGTARLAVMMGASVAYTQERYNPVLVHAAIMGNLDMVSIVLAAFDVNVNITGMYGRTALANACILNDVPLVKLLMQHGGPGLDVELPDGCGMTPLMHAAQCRSIPLFQLLLATGRASVHSRCIAGYTPLLHAITAACARYNAAECVELLLQAGADPCARDARDRTILRHAVVCGRIEVVKKLLDTGKVDPDAEEGEDGELDTAREMAKQHRTDAMERLLDNYKPVPLRISVELFY
ncbi:Histone-lysine N-methyltransferase ehmt2 [Purpureocillium takamizusanense]|uniref:Histone-lysine N-methyltransferase ehmt2 n=1 Tax=Purpureocillium takamizusanense TaxID=2060973 RepID=A0A9Q8QCI4_9HYPO|nr:Histone-lysine N-methyltransferase ehmt2 [Purpureocillium takamizusanense]UNI16484.1 Histone-lysine N-methyltransferase ehmt2 [Purpureocillium takamizusanense]